MKKNKLIYIVRHGQTDYNLKGIVQGSGVDTDLNETGLLQAQLFYNKYAKINFDKIYMSNLKRTQQSVQQFINDGILYQKFAELNEICWGEFEGKAQDIYEREFYQNAVNAWNNGNYNVAVAGGETPMQLQDRQRVVVDKIIQATNEKTILVCMHGRALKSMACLLLNQPLSKMDEYQHTNLGLYLFSYNGKKF